jgi:peptide/nickel transport system ATP-binding protein
MDAMPLIDIRDLSVGFASQAGDMLPVLRNIDFQIRRGETVGLVGESGSGKSTLALAAMGYLKAGLRVMGGSVHFGEREMFSLSRPALESIRGGKVALVPQNAGQSLTPTLRIGRQLLEAVALHSALPPGCARCACPSPRPSPPVTRMNSRAASNSAWPSPCRWRVSPTCCCSTSPPPGWM